MHWSRGTKNPLFKELIEQRTECREQAINKSTIFALVTSGKAVTHFLKKVQHCKRGDSAEHPNSAYRLYGYESKISITYKSKYVLMRNNPIWLTYTIYVANLTHSMWSLSKLCVQNHTVLVTDKECIFIENKVWNWSRICDDEMIILN